ncbi:MAG: peptidoglycan-binding domain-containing protein [Parcubacteria group bacterium]
MFKTIRIISLSLVLAFGITTIASADTFNTSLSYGSTNTVEVTKLQDFLFSLGYLKVPSTGAFFSLTKKAVTDFQVAENISPASGYFGPMTRAVANRKALTMSATPQLRASVSTRSVQTSNSNTATVGLANSRTITWQTTNYPANAGVNINLVRKTSQSPRTFSIVRSISVDTTNDGQETWIPRSGDLTGDVYIEVTCSNSYKFQGGCQLDGEPMKVN